MTRNPFKWPGTADKLSNKSDKSAWLKEVSDDELDDLMVQAGLMDQDALDRQRDSRLLTAVANLPGPPEYCETLRGLMKLQHEGPFPFEAQDLYDRLRARALADVKAAHRAAPQVTSSPTDIPADKSLAGWLKGKWASADEALRETLQAVAEALGIDVPLTRTRRVGGKDLCPTRRSDPTLHLTHVEQDPPDSPPEAEYRYDGPQWSDDDAPEWESCSSLHDALRSDDQGWY